MKQEPEDDDQPENAVLAENMKRLRAGRSIEDLRKEMADAGLNIGTGTLHRAIQGKIGNRLASLEKIASFFGFTADQLLQPNLGADNTSWPFSVELLEKVTALDPPTLHDMEVSIWAWLREDVPESVAKTNRHNLRQIGAGVNSVTDDDKRKRKS